MRKDSNVMSMLAASADVINTIGGGLTEPVVRVKNYADKREIRVRVPGVEADLLKVEINNNWLTIYNKLAIASWGSVVEVPRVLFNKAIPHFVNVEEIMASVLGDTLVVELPFNERSNGYKREVKVSER